MEIITDSEYVRHATIALISDREKTEYSSNKLLRSKVWCKKCGIEYLRDVSPRCPLCEIKEMLLASQINVYSAGISRGNENGKSTEAENHEEKRKDIDTDSAAKEKKALVYKKVKLNNCKKGDFIKFGKYRGKDIEWQVIQINGNKMLVVSKYCLEGRSYHTDAGSVSWETSTIRRYLNTNFINNCFSADELDEICVTNVENNDVASRDITGGKDTKDRIFLLSVDEARKLFNSKEARKCAATEYAKKNTAGWWWLRSSGKYDNEAAYVSSDGTIMSNGYSMRSERGAVRPAMWLEGNTIVSAIVESERPIRLKWQTQNVREYKRGDIVRLGVYAGQPVEWLVLKAANGRALLLSKYVLDVVPYNSKYTKSTWESCSLRSYLNGEFYQNTFTDSEKKVIESVCLDNKTNDRIFCLSINEADSYFRNDTERCAVPTSYAVSKIRDFFMEVFINKNTKAASWWLRTTFLAYNNKYAFCVSGAGESSTINTVNDDFVGIRPALWIKL